MALLGTGVAYRLHADDCVNYGPGQLGADEGEYLPATITSEPAGVPLTCNLKVEPNSSERAFFIEARAQGTTNGTWALITG